jgi:hypothetical protein
MQRPKNPHVSIEVRTTIAIAAFNRRHALVDFYRFLSKLSVSISIPDFRETIPVGIPKRFITPAARVYLSV